MRYIKLATQKEAEALNARVTQDCIDSGKWDGNTNNYSNPEHNEFWLVPVLEGYEKFFTEDELNGIDDDHQQLIDDIEKGRRVIQMYLLDNRKIDITTEKSLSQLQKFSAIKALLEVGAIPSAKQMIEIADVDDVFTKERKTKYLNALL